MINNLIPNRIFKLLIFFIFLISLQGCKKLPTAPDIQTPLQALVIIQGTNVTNGYTLGINTSRNRTDWILAVSEGFRFNYPVGQSWGAAFVIKGTFDDKTRDSIDVSQYRTLLVEMKGEKGGEEVEIGIKDRNDPDNGSETKMKVSLTNSFKQYSFQLNEFITANLKNIYVVWEVVFMGSKAQTIYIRLVKYMP